MTTKQEVLQACTIEGNIVKLPNVKLERKLYMDVAKTLTVIGGKWKGGKTQGFVMPEGYDDEVKSLIGKLSKSDNIKKEFQYFGTPEELGYYLVSLADIDTDLYGAQQMICEPSAGQGALVKCIKMVSHPDNIIYCYELMDINRTILNKIDGIDICGDDFLNHSDKIKFTKIIANPPFSKNQDIQHIRKMYDSLKFGGRLVSVASNHWTFALDRTSSEFRQWLKKVNARIEDIAPGKFKDSGTLVGAKIIIINKK